MLILLCIPVITFSLLDLEKEKENEAIYQAFLREQQIKKDIEEKIYLTGKFDPSTREDFIVIPSKYTTGVYKMYLRKETLDAFQKMAEIAEKNDIELNVASATRNFDYQKNLWNNKWEGNTLVGGTYLSKNSPDGFDRFRKILEYSAAPGTSRHHWGTDIDINDANPMYFKTEQGEMVYAWLIKNASEFGFCQTYNLKGPVRPTGYNEEKWHWSYLPLAKNFLQDYKRLIIENDIDGFAGDEYAKNFNLINNYVLSINPECL